METRGGTSNQCRGLQECVTRCACLLPAQTGNIRGFLEVTEWQCAELVWFLHHKRSYCCRRLSSQCSEWGHTSCGVTSRKATRRQTRGSRPRTTLTWASRSAEREVTPRSSLQTLSGTSTQSLTMTCESAAPRVDSVCLDEVITVWRYCRYNSNICHS